MTKYFYLLLVSALAALSACAPAVSNAPLNKQVYTLPVEKGEIEANACARAAAVIPPAEPADTVSARREQAKAILANMTDEQKTGQLFVVGVGGLNEEESQEVFPVSLNFRQKRNLKKYSVGGVIFFGGNIVNDSQVSTYITKLQKHSKLPLFIAVDEEGGIVSRLGKNPQISVTTFPPMRDIGATRSPQIAFEAGRTIARDISKLGFNLDFAPVADIVTNPANTIIAGKGRSFSTEPEVACAMIPQFVSGMQGQNVSATLKHFPGHGDTTADTHLGRVYSDADLQRLLSVELLPFKAGITAGVDFVMISHISLPKVTGNDDPASMSPQIIKDVLRGYLGFNGIIISDDMVMEAVTKHYTPAEAAVKAFEAGSDMLIVKINFIPSYKGVLEAVKSGRISRERLDESVLKILELKLKRGIIKPTSESTAK